MKKMICLCLVFMVCFNAIIYVKADSSKVFKIGITDYEPMNYYDANGELVGFDTELAKYVCEKIDMIPKFVHIEWDCKELELNAGNIDCVWNALTYTEDRAEVLDFSYAYAKGAYIIVVKNENIDEFKNLSILPTLKFVVEENSIEEMEAEDYGLNYYTVLSEVSALNAVQEGRADACIVYSLSANKLLNNEKFSDLSVAHTLREEKFVIGLKKGSPYTKRINDALSEAKENGILSELFSKYNVDVCWDDVPNIYKMNEYKDVSSKHWAYDYIQEMSKNGIITGYGNELFGPEDNITRAQFAAMLCRFANIETTNIKNQTYSYVEISDWYATYVEAVKPYFEGYSNNTYFNPNTYAKREDIAKALVKYKGYDVSEYDESEFKEIFTDWVEIDSNTRKYVYVAAKNGLINGYSDKTFRGEANITRAEAATLFYKLLK